MPHEEGTHPFVGLPRGDKAPEETGWPAEALGASAFPAAGAFPAANFASFGFFARFANPGALAGFAPRRHRRLKAPAHTPLLRRTLPNYVTAIQFKHVVHIAHPMQAMRCEEHQTPLQKRQDALFQLIFGLNIQMSRGLVQQQDCARIIQERTGQGHPMRLTARKSASALPHQRTQALGQLRHQFIKASKRNGPGYISLGSVRSVKRDILTQRGGEQIRILGNERRMALPPWRTQRRVLSAIKNNRSRVRSGKSAKQAHEGRFP